MGRQQDSGQGITLGAPGAFDIELEMPDALVPTPQVVSVIQVGPSGVPATDRNGFEPIVGPSARFFAPAMGGGLAFNYYGRFWNSAIAPFFYPDLSNGRRWFQAAGTLAAGEQRFMNHGLEDAEGNAVFPDFAVAAPAQLPAACQDFAVTLLDTTQIGIKNYDGVNTLDFQVKLWTVHSVQANRADGSANQLLSRQNFLIPTGGGTVNVAHGLVGIPDFLSIFQFDVGALGAVGGTVVLAGAIDDTFIPLANADPAAPDVTAQIYAERTHSIQL